MGHFRALSPEFADYLRQHVAAWERTYREIEKQVEEAITTVGRVGGFVDYDRVRESGYVWAGRA